MKPYRWTIALALFLKLISTVFELTLPYILEHIVDNVVPTGRLSAVIGWGLMMFLASLLCWLFNIIANRTAVNNAHHVSYNVRQDLFRKTAYLSGARVDATGLPSLISRMTSDSYNVQATVQRSQTLCVRAPMMLIGGVIMTVLLEWHLAMILVVMLPFLIAILFFVTSKGIPMYAMVQQKLDVVVRVMRENITGIRVVKALSKTDFEKRRFQEANREMASKDIAACTVMAIPGPLMSLCINSGLAAVVIYGARRVEMGAMEPGVILAFLTYFNLINWGIMGLSRIFDTMSKGVASANRIDKVLQLPDDQEVLSDAEALHPAGDEFIRFEHVDFSYSPDSAHQHKILPTAASAQAAAPGTPAASAQTAASGASAATSEQTAAPGTSTEAPAANAAPVSNSDGFAGSGREKALYDINFAIKKGESLGIIGPTGCGKTTVVNLLLRFYDAEEGGVFVDGKDVRSYDMDELRRKFGVVFQNDMIFQNSLRENIEFSRGLGDARLMEAIEDAMAAEYVSNLNGGLDYAVDIRGANLSGGQRQRLLVARALAAKPEILILDDSSSALDYKTDASMRKAINEHYAGTTLIMVAQRVSSVMNLTNIMVMDNGRCIGYGSHEELLKNCAPYKEIYDTQMGEM